MQDIRAAVQATKPALPRRERIEVRVESGELFVHSESCDCGAVQSPAIVQGYLQETLRVSAGEGDLLTCSGMYARKQCKWDFLK